MFEDFLFNLCRNEIKRYEVLNSGIGYLLHTYKDSSIAKAVVFIDEKLNDVQLVEAVKVWLLIASPRLGSVVIEDGGNFNPSKNFALR